MSSSYLQEADKLIEEAHKHLKTGLFKWRADYDCAAPCFEKAALAYKKAKQFEKSAGLFLNAADCHYKNSSRFHAGKAYEEAGLVCKDMKKFDQFIAHFDHASNLYLEDGTPDTAALSLIRAGKCVEPIEPQWALEVFNKAADIYENEVDGRQRSAVEVVGRCSRLLVKMSRLDDAVKSLEREKQLYGQVDGGDHAASARLVCYQVLIHLKNGDEVMASLTVRDACEQLSGFSVSEEYNVLSEVIEALAQRDQQKASGLLRLPLFKYMDACYARLARDLSASASAKSSELAEPVAAAAATEGAAAGGDVTAEDLDLL